MKRLTSALKVAKSFISNNLDQPRDTYDGNMKLQKLLYFAQLIHLTKYDRPLFSDPIFAFENGSVVEEIRLMYRDYHEDLIIASKDSQDLSNEEEDTIFLTMELFGDASANELSDLNHMHKCWEIAFKRSIDDKYKKKEKSVISLEDAKKHDLENINQLLSAHEQLRNHSQQKEVVNGIEFYYDPQEISITSELLEILESYEGDEPSYTIYKDGKLGIVIY